jgi:hypothetical protein
MVRKQNPKEKMAREIAADFRLWLERYPQADRKKRVSQFDAIADAHYNLRRRKLKLERKLRSGVERESSPVR